MFDWLRKGHARIGSDDGHRELADAIEGLGKVLTRIEARLDAALGTLGTIDGAIASLGAESREAGDSLKKLSLTSRSRASPDSITSTRCRNRL